MIPGPILRRELRAASLRRDVFAGRLIMAVLLGVVVTVAGGVAVRGEFLERSVYPAAGLKSFGSWTLVNVSSMQVIILAFLVPSVVGGAIAEERERDTLPFLLLTRLTRLEIVLAKLIGRLAPSLCLTLVGMPFVVFSAYLAGLFPEVAGLAALGLISTTMTMGALSLHSSARFAQAGQARAVAMLAVWGWLLILPLLAFLPMPADPTAALMVWPIREVCRWVGPSSPLSLVTNRAWATSVGPSALAWRIGLMVLTQAALGVLAVGLAVAAMKRHEPRRALIEPWASDRPACGDDPIFWREHDLPMHGGLTWRPLTLWRRAVGLIRLVFLLLLQLASILLVGGLPIALVLMTLRLAIPAFQEQWLGGSATTARDDFTVMIQVVSAFVALLCLLSVTATSAGRITNEREKGSWLVLLTTPLDGREILGGKFRATARGQGRIAVLLLPLWFVGAACGAIHPLGGLLAALDLAAAIWLGLILGLWLGIRPVAPSTATSASALAALAITVLHVPYVLFALVPSRVLAGGFDVLAPWQRALALASVVLVPTATTFLAMSLTQRAFGRFDVYVGRPIRRP